jgi:hypothetical protein
MVTNSGSQRRQKGVKSETPCFILIKKKNQNTLAGKSKEHHRVTEPTQEAKKKHGSQHQKEIMSEALNDLAHDRPRKIKRTPGTAPTLEKE